ncbi:Fe-S cluster assembly protein SufD [Gluconacetobacter azotocaptans]|uniref:Fe-S cluster assembly protein SufD n=1 Tax=Gluconacetobacter azotocaptans TaxID=142834 RepID=A0A7W4PG32_9PROT|nr:Fe-S cluster assembly protein SufD [Gluconacetobacter azotocaptans]MBB2191189.1 Fe-S cluster assembly protein SufD [Gluconacetobacter azotocaptans]GBQ36553.1 iron-sulfur assembly protein SufD [Gluconacetobacter azotocaptans DSM 13594]
MNAFAPAGVSAAAFLDRYAARAGTNPARDRAADTLRRTGLPRTGIEAWKYTSLRALGDIPFAAAPATPDDATVRAILTEAEQAVGLGPDLRRAVFVNGRFDPSLSSLPDGVSAGRFHATDEASDDDVASALNAILAEDGLVLRVAPGADAGRLLLLSIGVAEDGTPISFHPRHRIELGQGAALSVLDLSVGRGAYLNNPVFDIVVADGARLGHAKMQAEAPTAQHLAVVHAEIGAGGEYDSFTLTLGAALARHEVHVRLAAPGAVVHVNGAQLLDDRQHADLTSVITHAAPDCNSRQTVKNVLSGHARGVFQGKILVERVAQKTDGYQMNQALLLSETAEIDAKPELEIYADDVRCSHGATVGALDPDQLFYLRSRGVAEHEARAMLVKAFLHDAVDLIGDEILRATLDRAVESWWNRKDA